MSAALISTQVVTQAHANDMPNPSFENGGGWSVAANHSIVSGTSRSGSKSLLLNSNGSTFTTFSNIVPATEGDEYVISGYVRAQNLVAGPNGSGDTPILTMRFRNGTDYIRNHQNKQTAGYRWAPYPKGANGTYGFTNEGMGMRFQIPDNGTSVQVGIRTWAHNTSGKTWWDDMSLTKLSFPDRGNVTGTYQAENANSITKAFIDDHELEYTGSGYVDVTANNAELTWNNVAGGGQRVISVRYAWEGFIQPLTIILNGTEVASEKPIATGRRGIYATKDFVVNMPNNSNTLKLRVGKKGGALGNPMIDKITVYTKAGSGGGTTPPVDPPPPVEPPPELEAPVKPTGLQASDSDYTDRVEISWNAVTDADNYQMQRNTLARVSGAEQIADTPETSFEDSSAEAGTVYYYRLRACNDAGCSNYTSWEQGSRAATGGGGNPGHSGGNLSAVVSNSTANADISANASDFVKLGDPITRMANVSEQISAVSGLGNTNGFAYRAGRVGHQWMNGTPVVSGDNVRTGLRVFNDGKGLTFSAVAGTTPRTLSVWITAKGLTTASIDASLTATLSDGSAPDFTTSITGGASRLGKLVVLSYQADSEDEQITVSLMKNSGHFVGIDAISLAGGDGGSINLPPVLDNIADQTITAGDTLFVDLSATDPEGTNVTFSATGLPSGATVSNSGNGLGSIEWQSQANDAGSITITVTAEDGDMKSSSQQFDVIVEPLTNGGSGMLNAEASLVTKSSVSLTNTFIKFAPTPSIPAAINSAGEQPFGDIIRLAGALANRSAGGAVRYSYNNAEPANGTNVKGGNRVFDPFPVGMRMEIDTDATPETTKLYVGVRDALVRVTFTMADGSAAQEVVEIDQRNEAMATYVIEVDHQAGSNNQILVVEGYVIEQTPADPIGFLQFEAATQ